MKKRLLSLLLFALMLFSSFSIFTTEAYAGDRNYESLTLNIDWNIIKATGHQKSSWSCSCYSLAYCRDILDNKAHYFYEYNQYGNTEDSVYADWQRGSYCLKNFSNKTDELNFLYNELVKGKPVIAMVNGSPQHYVAIVGFTDVTATGALSESNFRIIDPAGSSYNTESLSNYQLISNSHGYQVVYDTSSAKASFSSTNIFAAPTISVSSSSGVPKISWNKVSSAEKYEIYRSTDGKSFTKYATTTSTSSIDTKAKIGTKYYYKVASVKTVDGETVKSKYSNVKSITCTTAAPTISVASSSGVPKISWSKVTSADKYYIYRSTDGKTYSYLTSTTSTSYIDIKATLGTKYYYKVASVKTIGSKNVISECSNVTSITCTTAAPTISIARSSGKPKISWSKVTGADKHDIYRSTDGKAYSYLSSTTNTYYTNTGAASGTKYYYKVKAVKVVNGTAVGSAYSNAKSLLTTIATPTVTVTRTSGKPTVKWSALKGADKYEIYRSTDGKTFSKYVTTTKTSYTDTKASIGTTYYYKVKAISTVTSDANSALSAAKSIKCIPATPTLTVTATDNSAKLSWSAVTGADKYEIYRSTDGTNFTKYATTTKTAYTNSKLSDGTSYYYKVRALSVVKKTSVYSNFSSVKNITISEAYADITWTLEDGTLTISGMGKMPDYSYDTAPWRAYRYQITKAVINNGVTSIGECAFNSCAYLTSVTIPSGVTSIGDYAFNFCGSLTSITLPSSVTNIGDWAFFSCSSLTSITIPDSVTSIGEYAFRDCISLTSITIPNSVTSIGDYAFCNCNSLTSITIPDSVTSIGDYAFRVCISLTSINVSSNNTAFSSSDGVLFNKDKTKLVCFPAGKSANSYSIPSSVTSIGDEAFSYCYSLTSITIPDSVTIIGEEAFYYCGSLNDVYYSGTAEEWNKINIGEYNDDLTSATIHYNYTGA